MILPTVHGLNFITIKFFIREMFCFANCFGVKCVQYVIAVSGERIGIGNLIDSEPLSFKIGKPALNLHVSGAI